jgi:hypothetical protein
MYIEDPMLGSTADLWREVRILSEDRGLFRYSCVLCTDTEHMFAKRDDRVRHV